MAAWTVVDTGFALERDEELSYDTMAPRRNGATLSALEAADVVLAVGAADPVGMQRLVRGLGELAEVLPDGNLRIAGLGSAPAHGLKRGVVVNIDATVQSIQQALKEAEMMADCKITRVYTGITGSHIRGINSSGMVAVKYKEVTAADVARVV